jgi:acetolactate synthase I/II/III large subunit
MAGVADYLIDRLRAAGAQAIFGLPGGGGNLDLIDAAGRADLPFVLTTTETGSAIAAMAQAEITGAPGACLTTLGPGAASVVNGVACAHLDRAPLLVITDSYASSGAAFAHQRIDHRALLAPVVKWSGSLAPGRPTATIDDAFDHLIDPPPGPVHLDCPADFEHPDAEGDDFRVHTHDALVGVNASQGVRLIAAARKPLLIVGLGARGAEDARAIQDLCETAGMPAMVTYKAKGVVPDDHPSFAGIFTNAEIERAVVNESDLIIGVGFDPVEILPRPWKYSQPIVSLAPWAMADDHVPFRAQEAGSIADLVAELRATITTSKWDLSRVRANAAAARDAVAGYAGSGDPAAYKGSASYLTPSRVVQLAADRFAKSARVTVDAGAHMFPATMLWPVVKPNDMLISNGLSTMGFALPAAIGAGLLDRARPVVALTGDGGLLICLGELATAVRERLKIIVIVFNDASLTLIELKQQARKLAANGVGLGELDWPRIAEGFGMPAWSATNERELEDAMARASSVDGPSLIEAKIDRTNYTPMIKAIRG